jgi:gamma-glutamyltranspeptidase / glutathione hydrolase
MTRLARIAVLLLLIASSLAAGSQVVAKSAALSTVSPYATQVGLSVLKRGGNAIDAAVAVSFALAVAHPQAGNIGGGGFLVYYDAKEKTVWTLDYREVAPLAATRDMYLEKDGTPSMASQIGPMAGGVPGAVAGISAMHARFGTRPWPELIAPSIRLAREGVRVDSELTVDLTEEQRKRHIDDFPSTALVFYPNGKPLAPGSTLVQGDLAETLERIAINGPREFYEGATAKRIVESMQATGGIIGYRDLREYKPVWRAPIRIHYRDYDIYTMAPPSAGGLILGEALGILSGFDLAAYGFQTPRSIHLLAEAERRAYIDRNKYLGDPASVRIPYRELMSEERAKAWRASIDLDKASNTLGLTEPAHNEPSHTTHFSIVDSAGNIASITTTINDTFGSGFIVGGAGFFLNNEMDDFTVALGKPNRYGLVQGSVNAIEPGKKMASSMTPTIVLRNGTPYLVLGTPGGATIPTSVLQVFLNITVWNKSLYDAIAAPRYHEQGLPEDIQYERGKAPRDLLDKLNAMGHGVRERDPIGDFHGIMIDKGTITAVADPRHGGAAGGY